MRDISYTKLVISIVFCQLASLVGSLFTFQSVATWYPTLLKPSFTPPSWVFGPVWTTLYLLMGISLYLVWVNSYKKNKQAINLFIFQLMLNTLWSIVFFGLKTSLGGLLIVAALCIAIALNIKVFYKINKISAYLLIP